MPELSRRSQDPADVPTPTKVLLHVCLTFYLPHNSHHSIGEYCVALPMKEADVLPLT